MTDASKPFYGPPDYEREVKVGSPVQEPYRGEFQKDRARIIHSPVFRRAQGKTQLFPGDESDFFRNRLTHSLEVAQIARSIAVRLNWLLSGKQSETKEHINLDLVELAALAHDLGHPPFGHTGERALNDCMALSGGFEGNAQTLRILTRLEKRRTYPTAAGSDGFTEFHGQRDLRAGLNLCYRSLAAVLKYDKLIPLIGAPGEVKKGYYKTEEALVGRIKSAVVGQSVDVSELELRTIEMQIMDVADDIAYSTYDLEDALKAGFGSPIDLLHQVNENAGVRDAVARKLFKQRTNRSYPSSDPSQQDRTELEKIKVDMVKSVFALLKPFLLEASPEYEGQAEILTSGTEDDRALFVANNGLDLARLSNAIAQDGYVRAQFTSDLITRRITAIDIEKDEERPCMSKLIVPNDVRFDIDVLKHLTYELQIRSPRLKLIEHRGLQIVSELFEAFEKDKDGELLPQDWRNRVQAVSGMVEGEEMRKRIVCDYVAGMTDAYALDVHSRLRSSNPSVLFRPH